MGIFSRLFGSSSTPPVEQKQSAVGRIIAPWGIGQPVWFDRTYESFYKEAYQINAIAYRCTKIIASNAASVPLLLYRGDGEEVVKHPLLDLVRQPNPFMTGSAFFEAVYAYVILAGNAYIESAGPDGKAPKELWTLRPDRMKVLAGSQGVPMGYRYEANGQKKDFFVDQITGEGDLMHVRDFAPGNDWYGMSRIEAAAWAIDRHNSASEHNKALLDNGARPSGALIFEPVEQGNGMRSNAPLETIMAAETALEARHGGAANAGKPMVLGGNVSWLDMGMSPKDMDFGDGKNDAARDICNAIGVPHILLIPGASTYNNVREAKLDMWETTIIPLLNLVAGSLNNWLAPRFEKGLYFEYDLDEISALEPRREAKRKSVTELLDHGVIDTDEARDALQYDPRDPDKIGKVDATVLSALVQVTAEVGPEPLLRYLTSVGLTDKTENLESLVARANEALAARPKPALPAVGPTEDPSEEVEQ